MSKKSRRKQLFELKVLAICGAAVFWVNGANGSYAVAQSGIGMGEETYMVQFRGKAVLSPNAVAVVEPDDEVTVESIDADDSEECQKFITSMSWDADDSYMLAKIAMAEAEGEDTEGKALVMLVVLNRVWSQGFPKSIEEVIMQNNGTTYQFSPVAPGGRWWRVEPDQDCWDALELIESGWNESQGALYFESGGASKWHENHLQFLFQHGNHRFYTNKS